MSSIKIRRQIADAGELKLPPLPDLTLKIPVPRRIVVTGAPHAGKTTTVKALFVATGIRGIPEPAGSLIHTAKRNGAATLDAIRKGEGGKEVGFSERVLNHRVTTEEKFRSNCSYFLDRGLLDSLAYYRLDQAPLTPFDSLKLSGRYDLVFFLEPVPGIAAEGIRNEFDVRNQSRISQLILDAYTEHGYEVVQVPVMPLHERVRAIANHCRSRFC